MNISEVFMPFHSTSYTVSFCVIFLCSYFGEIFRTHGPLDPTDKQILESLSFLPEDRIQDKITKAGGIAKLLVSSGHFAMQGKLVCPVEEMGVVAASMSADSANWSRSAAADVGGSGKDNPSSQDDVKAKVTDSTTTPSPFAQKSSLSGLLSGGARQDYSHHQHHVNGRNNNTKPEEVGSKRNTRALAPKVNDSMTGLNSTAKRKVEDVIRRAKFSEEKDKEKVRKVDRVSGNTESSDKDSRSSSKDSRSSSKDSKSSGRSSKSDKNSGSKDTGSSIKDSGSSDEKRKKIGKDPGPLSSAKDLQTSDVKLKGFDKVSAMVRKGMDELSIGGSQRASSKDSSRSGSGSERSGDRQGSQGQIEELARKDMFSPTNSTSSMSSSDSSSGVATPILPPAPTETAEAKKAKSKKAKKVKSKAEESLAVASKPAPDTGMRYETVMVQTEPPLMRDKWVMTDTLPQVDSFRERYENAAKEKSDLQEKLERSEDQRFKLQKTHKRDVEQLLKQSKLEVKEVGFSIVL